MTQPEAAALGECNLPSAPQATKAPGGSEHLNGRGAGLLSEAALQADQEDEDPTTPRVIAAAPARAIASPFAAMAATGESPEGGADPSEQLPRPPAEPEAGPSLEDERSVNPLGSVYPNAVYQEAQAAPPMQSDLGEVRMDPGSMSIPPPPTHVLGPVGMSKAEEQAARSAQLDELQEPLTPEELAEYAEYLGMEPGVDSRYLWIAEQAACSPLPEGWKEMEDHAGNTFYVSSGTDSPSDGLVTSWEHPYDEFYRHIFQGLKSRQWELPSHSDVTGMATFLGIDPRSEASLMWVAHQATICPLPSGWEEREDEFGAYYVNTEVGLTTRAHPMDGVFKTVAAVEKQRLSRGVFSLARSSAVGEGSGESSLETRLSEEDGSGAYTFDWLTGRRVLEGEYPGAGGIGQRRRQANASAPLPPLARSSSVGQQVITQEKQQQLAARANGDGSLTINTPPRAQPLSRLSSAEIAETAMSNEAVGGRTQSDLSAYLEAKTPTASDAGTPSSAVAANHQQQHRVTLVSRQSGVGRPSKLPAGVSGSLVAQGRRGGGPPSRFGQRPTTRRRAFKARVSPFEHYPTGLPETRRPEGWQMLNPVAVWVWLLYFAWAWAFVLPLVRRLLPRPPET